jgi:hypothetical protein
MIRRVVRQTIVEISIRRHDLHFLCRRLRRDVCMLFTTCLGFLLSYIEERGSKLFQNVIKYLPHYTKYYFRRSL